MPIREISLKGVARKYFNETGDFNVIKDILGKNSLNGTHSVREKLEDKAEKTISYRESECIYGWRVKYLQTWANICVRIELDPQDDVSDAELSAARSRWTTGIESAWNEQWACSRSGEIKCKFSFNVVWTSSNNHHKVKVHNDRDRANMTNWDDDDSGSVAAHEYGHMIGNQDEYSDPDCPNRSPVNTGTIMDNNSNNIPSRMMTRFADEIDSNVVSI